MPRMRFTLLFASKTFADACNPEQFVPFKIPMGLVSHSEIISLKSNHSIHFVKLICYTWGHLKHFTISSVHVYYNQCFVHTFSNDLKSTRVFANASLYIWCKYFTIAEVYWYALLYLNLVLQYLPLYPTHSEKFCWLFFNTIYASTTTSECTKKF